MNIMHLSTNDIYLVYLDLDTPAKRDMLARTDSGPRASAILRDITDRLSVVVQDGKPYATELAAADKRHDIGCAVLDLMCQIHYTLAGLPRYAHLADRADAIKATLTTGGALIRSSYADEAATAARNRVALPRCIDTLRQMPAALGVTGADIAELFIGGGEEVREWLTRRAEVESAAAAARSDGTSSHLLHEAREVLVRLRSTLEGEVSWRPDLPADLPRQIFSVLDARIAAVAAAARGKRPAGTGQDATDAAADAPGEAPDAEAGDAPDADAGSSGPGIGPIPRSSSGSDSSSEG